MYRFQYVSDIHLEFRKKVLRIPPVAPFLLLAGDIGYPCRSLYREFLRYAAHDFEKVFLVAGNHEFYQGAKQGKNLRWFHPLSMTSILDKIRHLCQEHDNVYFLHNSFHDLPHLRIIGSTLWSDIDPEAPLLHDQFQIYKEGTTTMTVKDIRIVHHESREFLVHALHHSPLPVLVMTHHLPSPQMILPEYHLLPPSMDRYQSHFASSLDFLFRPPLQAWVCGHSHGANHQILSNNIPCVINAYGYPNESRKGASLDKVLEVEVNVPSS